MMIQSSQLATKLKKPPATISRWLSGKRKIGANAARELERVTGVPRLAWLYPDEFDNPYFKNGNGSSTSPESSDPA